MKPFVRDCEGAPMFAAHLPKAQFSGHWTPKRKMNVALAIAGGLMTEAEATERYQTSAEELRQWRSLAGIRSDAFGPAAVPVAKAARRPLTRTHSMVIVASGNTAIALADELHRLANRIADGEERSQGATGGEASDVIFEYRRDPAMTRDRFFAALERRVIEQTSDRRRR